MANYNPSWRAPDVGINNVPAYQVSGRPYATGSCQAATLTKIDFPFVTRWVTVQNRADRILRFGFSEAGLNSSDSGTENYYYTVPPSSSVGPLEMKVSSLYFVKDASSSVDAYNNLFDVVAGLTTIQSMRTSGTLGPNFSGSYVGV
jgi:hypothetical protein